MNLRGFKHISLDITFNSRTGQVEFGGKQRFHLYQITAFATDPVGVET